MAAGSGAAGKECESCRSAPGIPFCRVEWSFLCGGCAAVVHANNWIVAVPPNPNPSATPHAFPQLPFPFPNPNPNLNPDPNRVVQLSSDEEDRAASGRGRRRRRGKEAAPPLRVGSVMRYREKRKSRKFEKTVRYETRKSYAEQRPRVDGKFARPAEPRAEGTQLAGDEVGTSNIQALGDELAIPDAHFQAMASAAVEGARQDMSEELIPVGGEEFVLMDAGEELRLH